ncbi:MAG: hypothetical protein HC821_01125 [Lewinella sp.]|nr:hypothetical protein [Lewinella sp.]
MGQSNILLGPRKDFSYPVKTANGAALAEYRWTEQRQNKMQPSWKLAYTGSVGGQALVGIPHLYRLRYTLPLLAEASQIWPFETGFSWPLALESPPLLVLAEIYPSIVDRPRLDPIPDREQVIAYHGWLQSQQANGELASYLGPPQGLSETALADCVAEEGWVLGVR